MKYIRFSKDNEVGYGILEGDKVHQIDRSYFEEYKRTGKQFELSSVRTLMPCAPKKVVAVGMNYADHIKELGLETPAIPVLFIKLPHTLIGPDEPIRIPRGATRVDYEAELAIVIKKTCKDVSPAQAGEYIFGATCLNDVTERDQQKQDGQWIRCKNYETFCPIGPVIADDIDYNNVDVTSKLNGQLKQNGNTSTLLFSVEMLISFISKSIPLYAGDIVTTGTPFGVSPMKEGDKIEVCVQGIGCLRNTVVSCEEEQTR